MNVPAVVQITLAPLLLVSSTGLLILGLGNRMGRVIDRLREFSREIRSGGIDEERRKVIMCQKGVLLRRARLCRNAMLHFHLTILFAALSSIFMFFSSLHSVFDYLVLGTFVVSLMTLLIGAIFAALEISLSYSAILREAKVYLRE
ncbi:MAG: DUF2721 domain-containing protein [Euryarchaeota archaeon]|nr:DUF2721 domain-containing protein [Euryarchaeota archaeon]